MRRSTLTVGAKLLLLAVVVTALAGPPGGSGAGKQGRSQSDYDILTRRNIFRRDRRAYRPPTSRPSESYTYDSDSALVLTGIARDEERYVAFFEKTSSGSVTVVAVGEAIGKGKVGAITLDHVQYERDAKSTRIDIGLSLAGTARPVLVRRSTPTRTVTSAPMAVGPTTQPAGPVATGTAVAAPTSPAGPSDEDVTDLIEQMMRRRQQGQ